ncbi:hypothetical protein E2C01_018945 [Portunus trituberculatus]|uniref:Uncharacterized protein n=1 Tax=Portunus trituberculatus TaxID=210409 RepID=A0A5B7DVW9_PORTR|nr:hypothetical protein [Portunus trituberculatus]
MRVCVKPCFSQLGVGYVRSRASLLSGLVEAAQTGMGWRWYGDRCALIAIRHLQDQEPTLSIIWRVVKDLSKDFMAPYQIVLLIFRCYKKRHLDGH